MLENTAQAIAALQDTKLAENQRVDAARFLAADPSPDAIAALVTALADDDHGVRWAAGSALGHQGEAALPALLSALMTPGVDKTLRDGARHVLVDNSSARVRELSVPLVKALKGPEADIAAMQEAQKLLAQFR
ncbi:MAG TPA: HEAT repeat domain-containing protein [Anaerolineae bacterium]|nr:HEAT repeat domain-containing protein [Anaerolineae bacterium]